MEPRIKWEFGFSGIHLYPSCKGCSLCIASLVMNMYVVQCAGGGGPRVSASIAPMSQMYSLTKLVSYAQQTMKCVGGPLTLQPWGLACSLYKKEGGQSTRCLAVQCSEEGGVPRQCSGGGPQARQKLTTL